MVFWITLIRVQDVEVYSSKLVLKDFFIQKQIEHSVYCANKIICRSAYMDKNLDSNNGAAEARLREIELISQFQNPLSSDSQKSNCLQSLLDLNKGIIHNEITAQMKRYRLSYEHFEDILQDVFFALTKIVLKFDTTRGFRLMSFARHSIRRAVIDFAENNSRPFSLPKNFFREVAYLQNGDKKLSNISSGRAQDMVNIFHADFISLDQDRFKNSSENLYNSIPAQEIKVFNFDMVNFFVSKLNERERFIVTHTNESERGFAETARVLNLSRERVRQLHRKACSKLKLFMSEKKIYSSDDFYK
jgi:RNA polymerase sigma factor (sigma-70 family)